MAGNSSSLKGKRGERGVCKKLTEYLGGSFQRVPSSGARVGGKNIKIREQLSKGQVRGWKGDIIPPDEFPKLVIESKNYSDFKWHSFALNESIPVLDTWLKELDADCDENDIGILCVKLKYKNWMIGFKPFTGLKHANHVEYNGYYFMGLDYFFQNNTETFKKLIIDDKTENQTI